MTATRYFKSYDAVSGSPNVAAELSAKPEDLGVAPAAATASKDGHVPFEMSVYIPNNGSANDLVTRNVPRNCRLTGIRAIKTEANSASGDKAHVRTAAGGGGVKVAEVDLDLPGGAALPDTQQSVTSRIDDSAWDFEEGAKLYFGVTRTGNTACYLTLTFEPLA